MQGISINSHQLSQIIANIAKSFDIYGTISSNGKLTFAKTGKFSELIIPTPKTRIPFKKILWANHQAIDELPLNPKIKFAFVGIVNCDVLALDILLKEMSAYDFLPKREDILIISTECKPDDHCFCTAFGHNKITGFDLHIQKDQAGYSIYSGSKIGNKILKENGLNSRKLGSFLKDIKLDSIDKFNDKKLSEEINNRKDHELIWQGVANNCFGCGACTAVCPLCFCTRQDFSNKTDGTSKICLEWDSCFAKSFSEIQNHYDLRPENVDRLYNWYHHKFVRAYKDKKHFLCTGCGRCIKACPAHLNQHNILEAIETNKEVRHE
ncbi:MAG: 4Fe-4S dicluster domain-containing protein [Candidatus Berkelbacteria bacterium]